MELTGVLISTSKERFAAMRDFYVTRLGLHPRSDRDGFVNFDFGHSRLTVAVHSAITDAASEPARIIVNLATPDVREALARCDPARIVRPPEREKWGGMVATVTDPDGNYVQFLQLE